ncbi:MAG: radical SAM protein [Pseudomonadota bacterium]
MNIRYLILVLTTRCNLRCRYCYAGDSDRNADMTPDVMERAFALAGESGRSFHLQLTGGEPTLVPERIEAAARLARNTVNCRSVGIQTNATRLTPELLTLLKHYDIQIGVSFDGPPAVHQQQRGMASETLKGLGLLESARVPFRVTTVVTRFNAMLLDHVVLALAGYSQARGIALDLVVNKGQALSGGDIMPADRCMLEKGLPAMRTALDRVNARRAVPIQWREWDRLRPAAGVTREMSAFCHAAHGQSVAVTPDGRLFPCGQTLEDFFFRRYGLETKRREPRFPSNLPAGLGSL